ncbi:hypothetical protein VMCG_06340 [Cytospora schulzeri]|uniref:Ubiquitin-like domain-containing protein n=1 Tax=Cytospora schulzeri TaxID=448051 RepID=A0A423W7W0_9PEZI|nr:hypothetical protein VMCG_06340 [Valsa malicola]
MDPPPAKAPKKKKPLAFLKSAPKPAPTIDPNGGGSDKEDDGDEALNLFRRSKDFFPIVVQEQESPREETPLKKKKSDEGDHDSEGSSHSPPSRSVKRRKLSYPAKSDNFWESPEDLYGPATPPQRVSTSPSPTPYRSNKKRETPSSVKSRGGEKVQLVQNDVLLTPTRSNSHQPLEDEVVAIKEDLERATPHGDETNTRSSTRDREDVSIPFKKDTSSGPITLDDSDDDLIETASPPKEDDPFAYFLQRARECEDAAKAAAEAAAAARINDETDTLDGETSKKREPMAEAKIFVFSRISKYPDFPGFGAKRGLHQNLGVIRRAYITWMRNKGVAISDEEESHIFLTWKGRRIYDVSTGISLGWHPSASGEFPTGPRTSGFMKNGILLEAWTQEDLDEELAAQEMQKRMDRGELVEDFEDDQPGEEQPEAAAKVRISLKEKDQEPVKMSVQGDYEIRLVIGAYRKMKKIPDDREVKLSYEGEWLDGGVTVNEADIDDLCTVEVYIK